MKTIIIEWVKNDDKEFYAYDMKVIKSDHLKYKKGSRFDFGYFQLATIEGYTIISLPPKK